VAAVHVLVLIGSALAIYLACEWFVNAVEWLGVELKIGATAVGTVLAAIGTALPESVVTLVAVVGRATPTSKDVGVGAALGGPLVLSTIAYGIIGLLLLRRRVGHAAAADPLLGVDRKRLIMDQSWFIAIYLVTLTLGLVSFAHKSVFGYLLLAVYGVFLWREIHNDDETASDEGLEPLKLQRHAELPARLPIVLQMVGTLAVIFVASEAFVHQLEWTGTTLGLSAAVVALLLSPVATELPEIMNAVIWVRQDKTPLALANVSGSMMIQATVPAALGLLFTTWSFDAPLVLAGVTTLAAICYLSLLMRRNLLTARRLAAAALFYVGFGVGLLIVVN
jgi:cation:H+ antiporter